MHIDYLPIVNVNGKRKLSCRSIWKGKNTYHELQESYYKYITDEKGYDLERGEVGSAMKHLTVSELKDVTNFEVKRQKENDVKQKYYNNELKSSNRIVSYNKKLIENTGIMKKGTYEKEEVDRVINEYQKEVAELSKQSDKKDEVIANLTQEYNSISEKRLMQKAEFLEKENINLREKNRKLEKVLNVIKSAYDNLLNVIKTLNIFKSISLKHNEEINIVSKYEDCNSLDDIEIVNKEYNKFIGYEDEEEMEM